MQCRARRAQDGAMERRARRTQDGAGTDPRGTPRGDPSARAPRDSDAMKCATDAGRCDGMTCATDAGLCGDRSEGKPARGSQRAGAPGLPCRRSRAPTSGVCTQAHLSVVGPRSRLPCRSQEGVPATCGLGETLSASPSANDTFMEVPVHLL